MQYYPEYLPDPKHRELNTVFHAIMEEEGGYVNHPDDRGGATRYGISLAFLMQQFEDYPETFAKAFPNRPIDQPPDIDLVRVLTKSQAKFFFFEAFAKQTLKLNLPLNLFMEVTDLAFNAGPRQAVRTLQRALNRLDARTLNRHAYPDILTIDGIWGPRSARAFQYHLAQHGASKIEAYYRKERIAFYKHLVKIRPSQRVFLRGWIKRAKKVRL